MAPRIFRLTSAGFLHIKTEPAFSKGVAEKRGGKYVKMQNAALTLLLYCDKILFT